MTDLVVTLWTDGIAQPPEGTVALALGYAGNRGVYRLVIRQMGEWKGLTVRLCWHGKRGKVLGTNLVKDAMVEVPDIVTAEAGHGVCTFEGTNGDGVTITSADLPYIVQKNSGVEDGTMPKPGTPAWEEFINMFLVRNLHMATEEETKAMLDEIFEEE